MSIAEMKAEILELESDYARAIGHNRRARIAERIAELKSEIAHLTR